MSLRSLFSAKDMTRGRPWKRIMEFALPMLIGNLAQQLYNTADTVIVGIYVGDNWMLHCGDPIQYADLSLSYWQQHLYAYGRLP